MDVHTAGNADDQPRARSSDRPARPIRVAVVGAGFWASYQLAAWAEQQDAVVVAIANRTVSRARELAQRFGIPSVHPDLGQLLAQEDVDVVDVITAPSTHLEFVRTAADHGISVICQKPLAPDLKTARAAAAHCEARGVRLLVHENFRWQAPMRAAARVLQEQAIGRPFRARIAFTTNFAGVYANQPQFLTLDRMILADLGVHLLDVSRFLFGEATTVSAQTHSVHPGLAGEDVATVMLAMRDGVTVTCEMSFATRLEVDPFPETLMRVEGSEGTLELRRGSQLVLTGAEGTTVLDVSPPAYEWADPFYAVAHASMVPCMADLLAHVRGEHEAETTAADQLRTLELVEAAYRAAASGETVRVPLPAPEHRGAALVQSAAITGGTP
jgi:predicted dehydrogenase